MLTLTPAIETRIAERKREQHARLMRRAVAMRLMVDRDYCRADGCVIWAPDVPGRCEVVTHDSCSCREFRLFGACPHHAAVTDHYTRECTT